jgi:protein-disulfide isomerase
MRKAFAFTAVLTLLACSSAPAQQATGSAGSEVAAKVGDRVIMVKELEDRWQAENPAEHAEAVQKVYDGRRNALEDIIADMLLGQAAKAKNMTADAYEEAEIGKRLKPVSDLEVGSFYQANVSQMQGRPLEAMAPLIRNYLQEQQRGTARRELLAELRKSGPAVRVMFEAPRTNVALQASDPSLGPASAPVTIIEFSDFQCPFCQRAVPTLKQVRAKYGDKVRLVWKDFPLTQIHPQAFKAAEAARCAADQGKFWEFHDQMFGNQQALQLDSLKKYAADMGLDAAKFNECLDSSKYAETVRTGVAAGQKLGVNSTPTLYINGRALQGAQPFETFEAMIDDELARVK